MGKIGFRDIDEKEILQVISQGISPVKFRSFAIGVAYSDLELKGKIRKSAIDFITNSFNASYNANDFDLYVLINLERGFVEIIPASVYIEGYYNKFSREIAQTFHYCFRCKGKGCPNCNYSGKISELSVQELLESKLLSAFLSKESKFHGAGREDVDVRMLGDGRPFILEILEPLERNLNLKKIEDEINHSFEGKISVHSLKFCGKARVAELKNSEFKKVYSALCTCSEEIPDSSLQNLVSRDFEILQVTPTRVLKRRVEKERKKKAKIISVKVISENEFFVNILASHGLYVKEFISGDENRTTPSISSLLGEKCFCKELDVLEIVIEK